MIKLNIYELKTQFSKYVELVEKGETIVICKRNVPVAEIRPIEEKRKRKPVLGSAAGAFEIPPRFYEPIPDEELVLWEGGSAADTLQAIAPRRPKRRK